MSGLRVQGRPERKPESVQTSPAAPVWPRLTFAPEPPASPSPLPRLPLSLLRNRRKGQGNTPDSADAPDALCCQSRHSSHGVRGPGALHHPHLAHVPLSPRPARSGELPSPRGPEVRTRLVLPTGGRSWFRRHLQHWPRCPEGTEVGRTPQGCSPSRTPTCQRGTWGTPTPANLSDLHFLSQPPSAQGALRVSSGAWRSH